MTNCSATILILCLLASGSDVSGTVHALRDEQPDVTGILATVMDQLAVIAEKQDQTITQMTSMQQAMTQLTERVDQLEKASGQEVIQMTLSTRNNMIASLTSPLVRV